MERQQAAKLTKANSTSRNNLQAKLAPQKKPAPLHPVLQLQRKIGNQAVHRLLSTGDVQTKLTISKPGDKYEQEADRVADQVMRMPEPPIRRQASNEEDEERVIQGKFLSDDISPLVQRQREDEEETEIQPKLISPAPLSVQRQEELEEEEEQVQPQLLQRQEEEEEPEQSELLQRQEFEESGEEELVAQSKVNQDIPVVQPLLNRRTVQTKLTVSEPGDVYEQEAHRMAEKVMRTPSQMPHASSAPPVPQRLPLAGNVLGNLGSGQPLDAATRTFFEPRLGHNFAHVRVHADAEAADLTDSVQARAYTFGRDIVFAPHAYAPATDAGKRLLAHELTHVLQARLRRDLVLRTPMNPQGVPFEAEVYPAWSTPVRERPAHGAKRLADLPRGHVVTVEGGKAWLRVSTMLEGKPITGFISHEQLRQLPERRKPEMAKPAPSFDLPPPSPDLRPLRGVFTEATEFFVRATPGKSGAILGKLFFEPMEVTILEAKEVKTEGPPSADLWYKVEFSEADFQRVVMNYSIALFGKNPGDAAQPSDEAKRHEQALRAHSGTTAWVGQAAFGIVAMPWDHFLRLLAAFEQAHAGDSLLQRLSRLRQIGEEPDVPGNKAVGAGADVANQINRGQRMPDPTKWQILLEAKQVELPNGQIVDIHHFILGLESLIKDSRRSESRTLRQYGIFSTNIGQSYAAATWSGDVGAAAADFVMRKSQDWEKASLLGRSEEDRLSFYFRTRAPEFDLLADIDAWGGYELVPIGAEAEGPVKSLVDLVTAFYGPTWQSVGLHEHIVKIGRARGIRNLLKHYGFASTTDLNLQTAAAQKIEDQIFIFSKSWYQVKAESEHENIFGPMETVEIELADASEQMTEMFLDWLEAQAKRYDVVLDEEPVGQ